MSAAANSATSPLPSAPDVEVDAEPDEEVWRGDNGSIHQKGDFPIWLSSQYYNW